MKIRKNYSVKNLNRCTLGLIGSICFIVTACSTNKKSNPAPVPPPAKTFSISETISADPNFSLLGAALIKTDLTTALKGKGTFTVFAPTNTAFKAAGYKDESAVNAADKRILSSILQYHILPVNSIPIATNTEFVTQSSEKLYVTKTDVDKISVNGIPTVKLSKKATNGTIQVINTILTVPVIDVMAIIKNTPNLTYLDEAIKRANLSTILSEKGPYTIFAPSNQAFIDAGYPTINAIKAADPIKLSNLIKYHLINRRLFSSDFKDKAEVQTLASGTITLNATGGLKIKGKSNTDYILLSKTDNIAKNGIVHVIDKILLP